MPYSIKDTRLDMVLGIISIIIMLLPSGVLFADAQNGITITEQPIPYRSRSMVSGDSLARLSLAVGLGISLVVLSIWVIKKIQHKSLDENSKRKKIRLIDMRRITPKLTLMIIEVEKKTYVLAQNNENVVRIDAYDSKSAENNDA